MKVPQIVLGLVIFAIVLLLPLPVPGPAKAVLATTLLMVLWWVTEAVPLEATALVPLVAFPLLGVLTPSAAAAPYADKVIFLFLGGFVIAMSMQRWGLHRRIALHIIRVVGTSPRRLVLGFMCATAFLSMWISNTATTMMMVPIALAIITTLMPRDERNAGKLSAEQLAFAGCLVIAIAYAASIGGIATIIGTPPNGIFTAQMEVLFPDAPQIDFFAWMTFGVPLMIVLLPATWLWLVYGPFRRMPELVDRAGAVIDREIMEMGPLGRGERWTLAVFLGAAFAWIFLQTKVIGSLTVPGLDMIFPGIDDATVAIAGAIALFLLPVDAKKGLFTMDWEWGVKIPWGILILFGGGLSLSTAFIQSGLAELLAATFTSLQSLPVIIIVVLAAVVVTLSSEVTSNTAIASIMMPVMAATSLGIGVHPYLLMLTAAICASLGFMFPVSTPPNAIAFGTGYVTMKQMIRAGWVLDLIGVMTWIVFIFTVVQWALGFSAAPPSWALP
jgi:sodium-dependent dicarboxylate transporter 2/3/5